MKVLHALWRLPTKFEYARHYRFKMIAVFDASGLSDLFYALTFQPKEIEPEIV
jgi:hypothetical protein